MPLFPENLTTRAKLTFLAHLWKAATRDHHRELETPLRPFIAENAVVFDIGAHAGQMAKLFARMAPKGRVYSFEPSPYARAILSKVKLVRCLGRVNIVAAALGDAPGEVVLKTPIKKSGSMGFGLTHIGVENESGAFREDRVPIMTLDSFVTETQLPRVDFIKADIEGYELAMLRGAETTLRRYRPVLMLEVHDGHLTRAGASRDALWSYLTGLGYAAWRIEGDALVPQETPADGDFVWRAV